MKLKNKFRLYPTKQQEIGLNETKLKRLSRL
ncbi:MAG: helix-turn-helix domain-containing protein [Methanosarcinaceae archaeon]|nr:helix-turn-helix domain-containing protein [Methanosarcinaceae archaeon]